MSKTRYLRHTFGPLICKIFLIHQLKLLLAKKQHSNRYWMCLKMMKISSLKKKWIWSLQLIQKSSIIVSLYFNKLLRMQWHIIQALSRGVTFWQAFCGCRTSHSQIICLHTKLPVRRKPLCPAFMLQSSQNLSILRSISYNDWRHGVGSSKNLFSWLFINIDLVVDINSVYDI